MTRYFSSTLLDIPRVVYGMIFDVYGGWTRYPNGTSMLLNRYWHILQDFRPFFCNFIEKFTYKNCYGLKTFFSAINQVF